MIVKLDHFPKYRGENQKYVKPLKVNHRFKNGGSFWKMINPTKIMVVRKPTYKKWWLDFQGNHHRMILWVLCRKNSLFVPNSSPALAMVSIWSALAERFTKRFLASKSGRQFVFQQPQHPGRLTWNLLINHLERKMIFQTSMVMFHVNLPGWTF